MSIIKSSEYVGNTRKVRLDIASLATLIVENMKRLNLSVKAKVGADGRISLVATAQDSKATVRYLITHEYVEGPNPQKFGTRTIVDAIVPNIEEDLYNEGLSVVLEGRRYVTYMQLLE